jgi:hypothetical protein
LVPTTPSDTRIGHHPSASIKAPGPCQAVENGNLTFTSGWKEYRAATYSGTTDDLRPGGIAPINEVSHVSRFTRIRLPRAGRLPNWNPGSTNALRCTTTPTTSP